MSDNDISKNINTDFSATGSGGVNTSSYAHPENEHILSQARSYLAQSGTGKRLLQLADQRDITIQILANKDITRFVPDAGHVYLGLASDAEPDYRHIVLNLGGALREAEHFLVGYAPPDHNTDPVDFAALSFAKELDIIINICRIAEELHESGAQQNMLDALEEMGHSEIYQSYKAQQSTGEMLDTFIPDDFGAEGEQS
jgi:hypothetical protein